MDLGLKDRRAVVLASTQGLGLAVVRTLLDEGARVAITGRNQSRLDDVVGTLRDSHGADRVEGEAFDVIDKQALTGFLERVAAGFGGIDILVTNAGGPPPGPAADITNESLDAAYHLTLESAINAVNAVLPGMRERKYGRILALTSVSVRQPIPGLALSNALRAGLTGYLKTLADEVAGEGILVNSICTGFFDTDRLTELFEVRAARSGRSIAEERELAAARIPVRRIGKLDEFGSMAAFLVSDRATYLSGVALPYDGGLTQALL